MVIRSVAKICPVCQKEKFMKQTDTICSSCSNLYAVTFFGTVVRRATNKGAGPKPKKFGTQARDFTKGRKRDDDSSRVNHSRSAES